MLRYRVGIHRSSAAFSRWRERAEQSQNEFKTCHPPVGRRPHLRVLSFRAAVDVHVKNHPVPRGGGAPARGTSRFQFKKRVSPPPWDGVGSSIYFFSPQTLYSNIRIPSTRYLVSGMRRRGRAGAAGRGDRARPGAREKQIRSDIPAWLSRSYRGHALTRGGNCRLVQCAMRPRVSQSRHATRN